MKIDAKQILGRLRAPKDRGPKSIYVSDKVWRDFEKNCEETPVSRVIEELMLQFIESAKRRKA